MKRKKKNKHFSKVFLPLLFVQLKSDMKRGVDFFCRENVLVKKNDKEGSNQANHYLQ